MLISVIGLIGLVFPAVHAGSSCTSASGNVDGFNACVAEALGSGGANDPKSACTGNTGDSYNSCMCAAAGSVAKCDHCAGDAGLRDVVGDQANYCNVKATTTSALTTAALLTTVGVSQTSSYFVTSSLVFSTFPASSLVTIPSATFSYPRTTVVVGVNMDDLPPFPDNGAVKDHVFDAIALSAITILMLFA